MIYPMIYPNKPLYSIAQWQFFNRTSGFWPQQTRIGMIKINGLIGDVQEFPLLRDLRRAFLLGKTSYKPSLKKNYHEWFIVG